MSRKKSPQQAPEQNVDEENEEAFLNKNRSKTSPVAAFKYVPVSLATALLGILIFYAVGSIDFQKDIVFIGLTYLIGVAGLTVAYFSVAEWTNKQRKLSNKNATPGLESFFFTIFYNNAIYVFLLLFGSSILFSSFSSPAISMILSQALASFIPAWLPSLSA